MLVFALLLSLSHNQEGVVSCNAPVVVGSAEISRSYMIDAGAGKNCTFYLDADVTVEAISVSRIEKPSPPAARVSLNNILYKENLNVTGAIEPFAILPMFNTIDEPDVQTGDGVFTIQLQGRAFVSFGVTEDAGLVFGKVVPHSYISREFVYRMPPDAMYTIHGVLAVLAVGGLIGMLISDAKMYDNLAVMTLRIWIVCSALIDVYIWSAIAIHVSGGFYKGVFSNIVAFIRVFHLMYFIYVIHETPLGTGNGVSSAGKSPPCKCTWKCFVAKLHRLMMAGRAFLLVYISCMLWYVEKHQLAVVCFIIAVCLGIGYIGYTCCTKDGKKDGKKYQWILYLNLITFNTLLGILLNLGAGGLAFCATCYGLMRRHRLQQPRLQAEKPTTNPVAGAEALLVPRINFY